MEAVVFTLLVLALLGYVIWEFVRAVRDPYEKPDDELLPNESNEKRIYR